MPAIDAPDLIALAIPAFFLLIGVELVLQWIAKRDLYRFNDSINDLSHGTFDQILGAFFKAAIFAFGYVAIYENYRLFDIDGTSILMWILCLLGFDFFYYWAHRASHEVNAIWGSHIAHHSSEEYNLSVALRQGAFQGAFFWVFYLPLAFIGFPPVMFLVMGQVDTLYQFWIHTRTVGKLGPLEWVLNTPSHHRVHHGQNPKYIDKNHGGILIVWDRLFGTFQEEEEEPVYGIVTPLRSWNPVWGQVHYWARLFQIAWRAPKWSDKLLVWIMPPSWKPQGLDDGAPRVRPASRAGQQRYNPRIPLGLNFYVLYHYVATVPVTVVFLAQERHMALGEKALYAAYILSTLWFLGGVMEAKRWALRAEGARLITVTLLLAFAAFAGGSVLGVASPAALYAAACLYPAIAAPWLLAYRKVFIHPAGALPESPDGEAAMESLPLAK